MPQQPTDLEIARAATPRPIREVAADLGVPEEHLEHRGRQVAKISLKALDRMGPPRARYILVTATNPTPLGEGKTTVAIGLTQGLRKVGRSAAVTLRQPSLGPTFGIKGGAAGGGYSQVIPMEEMNLHLTGDFHAVSSANNMLAALLENHLYRDDEPRLDPHSITLRRVVDVNDRCLRDIVVGLGGKADGDPRQTGFVITSASEVMAILGLATSLKDLRERLGRMVVGFDDRRHPVTAEDIRGAGVMAVLLKDALDPNLLQTLEGGPALVHTGPFANIAHGNSSVVADYVGIRGADFLVTEAGFGADIGAEKFFNLKCRVSGLEPDAAVLVTTARSLKLHSGKHRIRAGRPLPAGLLEESPGDVRAGAEILRHHIEVLRRHGVVPVVAINAFPGDHESEHDVIADVASRAGVRWAIARPHTGGGEGMTALAREIVEAAEEESTFELLYPDDMDLKAKIEIIAREVYGADGVKLDSSAERTLGRYERLGWGHLPVCMAKTQYSLTHNETWLGVRKGWTLPVREVRASVGAGFILPLTGSIRRMPGLSTTPAAHAIDLDAEGNVVGLS